jgi:nitrogenase molybdenum-iron protein beta chain
MHEFIEQPRSSCALGGALAAISALPDIVPIIHAATGCAGNLYGAISAGAGGFGAIGPSGGHASNSAISETEVIFGGAERLQEQILSTLELIEGKLYVVLTGCMTEMIGDDVHGAIAELDLGPDVIAINTPSFKGDSYTGYEILLDGIFHKWLPQTAKKDERLVNLFGIVPAHDPFFRGDLEELSRLLGALGLKVNTFFTPDQTFDNILSANTASLNILLSPTWGKEFVQAFQERHGTPSLEKPLPIGAEQTDDFLTVVASYFEIDAAPVLKRENHIYYNYFERIADLFCDSGLVWFNSASATNSNYLIPIVRFAEKEFGWIHLDAYVTDQLDDTRQAQVRNAYNLEELQAELIFEPNKSDIARLLVKRRPLDNGSVYFDKTAFPLFLFGSALEKSTAQSIGAQGLTVSYPAFDRQIMDRGYAGYRGGLHLVEDILGSLAAAKG